LIYEGYFKELLFGIDIICFIRYNGKVAYKRLDKMCTAFKLFITKLLLTFYKKTALIQYIVCIQDEQYYI